jgi:hypothetical protein
VNNDKCQRPKCNGQYTYGSALYRYFSCGHSVEKPLTPSGKSNKSSEQEKILKILGNDKARVSVFFLGAAWACEHFSLMSDGFTDKGCQQAQELVLEIQALGDKMLTDAR